MKTVSIKYHWGLTVAFIIVWVFIAGNLLGIWLNAIDDGTWKTLTNDTYNFSVQYPTKWRGEIYGEHGYKGLDELKASIYNSIFDTFSIKIRYLPIEKLTLEGILLLSEDRLGGVNAHLKALDKSSYSTVSVREDLIRNHQVLRHVYERIEVKSEDIYIARENDIIIITLQSNPSDFDFYLEDFERIVQSFQPIP